MSDRFTSEKPVFRNGFRGMVKVRIIEIIAILRLFFFLRNMRLCKIDRLATLY